MNELENDITIHLTELDVDVIEEEYNKIKKLKYKWNDSRILCLAIEPIIGKYLEQKLGFPYNRIDESDVNLCGEGDFDTIINGKEERIQIKNGTGKNKLSICFSEKYHKLTNSSKVLCCYFDQEEAVINIWGLYDSQFVKDHSFNNIDYNVFRKV